MTCSLFSRGVEVNVSKLCILRSSLKEYCIGLRIKVLSLVVEWCLKRNYFSKKMTSRYKNILPNSRSYTLYPLFSHKDNQEKYSSRHEHQI